MASDKELVRFANWEKVAASTNAKEDVYILTYRRVPTNLASNQTPVLRQRAAGTRTASLKKMPGTLKEIQRPSALENKGAVLEAYRAELASIEERPESPAPEPYFEEDMESPDDVQEAINGLRLLKSILRHIPDVPNNPEDLDALKDRYWKMREDFLIQLGAGTQAEEHQRAAEDIVSILKQQPRPINRGTQNQETVAGASPRGTKSEDELDTSGTTRDKQSHSFNLEESMRGLVEILFTPDGSEKKTHLPCQDSGFTEECSR